MYMSALSAQKRASEPVTGGCEPPRGGWGLNSGPQEEQTVFLTAEPSLQPITCYLRTSELLKEDQISQ